MEFQSGLWFSLWIDDQDLQVLDADASCAVINIDDAVQMENEAHLSAMGSTGEEEKESTCYSMRGRIPGRKPGS